MSEEQGTEEAAQSAPSLDAPLVSLLIRRSGRSWRTPEMSHYADEGALEKLLADAPELLGTKERRAVVRQLHVPGVGPLDICAVGPSGTLTLIECKLRKNPEIRRTVVGQLFAYASGLWGQTYEQFDRLFTARSTQSTEGAVAEVVVHDGDWSAATFRESVSNNLRDGRFDLVFAVDSLTDELKQVVRYLNDHTMSGVRVFALELGYARDGDVEVLVPAVYGEESAAHKRTASTWTESAFFEALKDRCTDAGFRIMADLFEHAREHGVGFSWGGGSSPSASARFMVGEAEVSVWTCWASTTPTFTIDFDWMWRRVHHDRLRSLVDDLRERCPGLEPVLEGLEQARWRRLPSISVDDLAALDGVGGLVEALDVFIAEDPRHTPGGDGSRGPETLVT